MIRCRVSAPGASKRRTTAGEPLMEGARFLLAIVLSIAVVILVNLMFPPSGPRPGAGPDSVRVDTVVETRGVPAEPATPAQGADSGLAGGAPDSTRGDTARPVDAAAALEAAAGAAGAAGAGAGTGDTVWVQTDVARYGISTLGGAIVSVQLLEFDSHTRAGAVDLVEPESPGLVDYGIRVRDRVLPLSSVRFTSSAPAGDTLRVDGPATVALTADVNGLRVRLGYAFDGDRYVIGVDGRVEGLGDDATLLLGLGPRLAVNEADSAEDLRALAYVVNSRQTGIESVRIEKVEQDRVEEGPLSWVALKNKYFVAAAVQPMDGQGAFGGLIAKAGPGGASSVQATLPLDREGAFDVRLFFGPQEYGRLAAVAEELEDVNPYGWRLFRPIILPLAHLVIWLLTGLHNVLGLGYGWVLIIFGFAMRGLLWPLNAKAMRSQLKTMELQPRIKEIQTKYKEKPELLQKEMMRLYKEEGFNPLGGCLPMLIPWPVLITLFFVFQNTIEFRGVEFLWLPDLSRPDPLYILPVVLGVSLFALQFMNMRAAPQDNPQQKMLMYFMPVMMVVIFLNFASGLNLYYAASNVASLPQQLQIIGERKRARARIAKKQE